MSGVRSSSPPPKIMPICKHCGNMNEKALHYCNTTCQNRASSERKKREFLEGKYIGQHLGFRGWARRLVEDIKGKRCESCGNEGVWNGKPITLQVDHEDGIATNNSIENVRLLCPNCHSQTETYGSKNIGRSTRTDRRKKI